MHKTFVVFLFFIASNTFAQNLWQPYYITPRTGEQHKDLSADWELNHTENTVTNLSQLPQDGWFDVPRPASVHWALHWAGKLPNPYVGMNSKQYEWAEEAVWYYRKSFIVDTKEDQYHFLHFDGIDYFARIWLNGAYLGEHEGMFGGPSLEVSEYLRSGQQNELVVEVKSANFNNKETYEPRNPGKIIKPWEFAGGSGAEPWFTVGMWQGVRLETVPKTHLERPFLTTQSIENGEAQMHLQTEVFVNAHSLEYEMHPWEPSGHLGGTFYYDKSRYIPYDEPLTLEVNFGLEGKNLHTETFNLDVFEGRNWVNKSFTLPNPRLWWPNGMGEQPLYEVSIRLLQEGKVMDKIVFPYGIRTIENEYTAGPQFSDVRHPWQFVVNGRKIFVKGVNWMPADVLLDLPKEQYAWILGLAREAGIQMVRIWGAGLLETEAFYDVCDSLGIMVWQDFPIANYGTPEWPMDVWEAQVTHNIFRLRNRTSLALYNGGNEFNPYGLGNTTSIGILERNLQIFDPTRLFTRTSPDGGAIHTYPDFDPVWYTKSSSFLTTKTDPEGYMHTYKGSYRWAQYVSETGMHSIPEARGLYEIVDPAEFKNLGNMYTDEFANTHPEFIHHFVEFNPARVPRMLSRASHIDDMHNPSLESIAEASQIGAGEFYQVMSEKIQANYPVTAGLMPWVFKRPWPIVAAIHLVDGNGQPSAPYYFLKRTYEPLHVSLDLDWLLWQAGEKFPVKINVMNATENALNNAQVDVKVYNQEFDILWENESTTEIEKGPSVQSLAVADFQIPDDFKNQYFFVTAELKDRAGKLLSRSVYWPRTIPQMEEEAFKEKYRSEPVDWPTLENGPWLRPIVGQTNTKLKAELLDYKEESSGITNFTIKVQNTGNIPAFLCSVNAEGAKRTYVADDNFFWLAAGEEKTIKGKIRWTESLDGKKPALTLGAWNAKTVQLKLK